MRKILYLSAILLVTGCTAIPSKDTVEPYKNMQPSFNLEEFFTGKVKGYGIVFGRGGDIKRRFDVSINGQWDADKKVLTLNEDFSFYDGETDKRTWVLNETSPDVWQGRANDTLGMANGISAGNTFHWQYKMPITAGNREIVLLFDDWMYLMNDGKLLNKTTMKKFGIKVGELVLFMEREE